MSFNTWGRAFNDTESSQPLTSVYSDLNIRVQILDAVEKSTTIERQILSSVVQDLNIRNQFLSAVYSDLSLQLAIEDEPRPILDINKFSFSVHEKNYSIQL